MATQPTKVTIPTESTQTKTEDNYTVVMIPYDASKEEIEQIIGRVLRDTTPQIVNISLGPNST